MYLKSAMNSRMLKHTLIFVFWAFVSVAFAQLNVVVDSITVPQDSLKTAQHQLILKELDPQRVPAFRIYRIDSSGLRLNNENNYDILQYFGPGDQSIPGQKYIGIAKYHRENWLLLTVFFLIFGIGLVRLFFPADFKIVFQAYYDDRVLLSLSKEDTILTSWPFIFLYILFSGTLALFVCLFYAYELDRYDVVTFSNYFKITALIGVLFALKIGFIRFLAFVFEIGRIVREYVAILYLIYFNVLFFLLPVILTLSLVPVRYAKSIFIFAIVASVLIFFYRFIRTAIHVMGQYRFSLSYLILYLCCLEIAPIIILLRLLS